MRRRVLLAVVLSYCSKLRNVDGLLTRVAHGDTAVPSGRHGALPGAGGAGGAALVLHVAEECHTRLVAPGPRRPSLEQHAGRIAS